MSRKRPLTRLAVTLSAVLYCALVLPAEAQRDGPARDPQGRQLNLWPEIDDRDPPGADLFRVSEKLPFRKCVAGDPYDAYIDEIVLGRTLAARVPKDGYVRVTYTEADAKQRRLSDHCPVGVDLSLR